MIRYFDFTASAPLVPAAKDALEAYIKDTGFGNANSLHSTGRKVFKQLESARERMASLLSASPEEIIFTGGATEADALALYGLAMGQAQKHHLFSKGKMPHILFPATEHHAILECEPFLRACGFEVEIMPVSNQGLISVETLQTYMRDETVLVSVMLVNNETGVIQPIQELATYAHEHGALFHTDAVQAFGKIPCNPHNLNVDALSISAHKVGGPVGVGVLYVRRRTPYVALIPGGGQERLKRGGTQNVMGIVAAVAACEYAYANQERAFLKASKLYERMHASFLTRSDILITIDESTPHSPFILHICVKGWESQALLLRLDMRGLQLSSGSACSSNSLEPSHVLHAMNLPEKQTQGALRFSFDELLTSDDIDAACRILYECLDRE
ncbi:MAG: cysteine desulfurase [Eggerthellaceae bacterium]|nr:cysteine desulfurase [Eggerthellaceae bacterium]